MGILGGVLAAVVADTDVGQSDVEILFVVLALVSLAGAAYLAYLRNVLGALLLVFVAIVALLFGT